MSDSVTQAATPTRPTPNFVAQAPTSVKLDAADPVLVKEVESFLANRAADTTAKPARTPLSTSTDSGPKVDAVPALPDATPLARAGRPSPDVSVAVPAAPAETGPKPDQVARPEPPIVPGSSENAPKAGRMAAGAELPASSERPAPEVASAKPSAPNAGAPRAEQGPAGGEPPPHPGPGNARAAGSDRPVVEGTASPPPARQQRKPKTSKPAADPRLDGATTPTEAPASAQAAAQRETKTDTAPPAAGQEKVHATASPGSGKPEPAIAAVAADYTAMADSAQRHAKDRYAVENNLHQRGLDPAALGERFTKKDAELGEKAASIPGREAGKNAMEEMAQKLAELLRKAMEKVGQAFGRTAGADAQATARPGPSPGMSP